MNIFCTTTKNTNDIEFINFQFVINNHPTILLFCIYFYTNKLVQKHNENVFTNTLSPMFTFKAMGINHQSCPPSPKLPNDPNKVIGFHFIININIYMLVELCVGNYATFHGHVNGTNGILKVSTTYCAKTIIWIMFQNSKIETLIREKYIHYYDNNIKSKWTPIELIIKYIRIGKSQSFIITRIQYPIQLTITRTIHHSQGLSLSMNWFLISLMFKNMG